MCPWLSCIAFPPGGGMLTQISASTGLPHCFPEGVNVVKRATTSQFPSAFAAQPVKKITPTMGTPRTAVDVWLQFTPGLDFSQAAYSSSGLSVNANMAPKSPSDLAH